MDKTVKGDTSPVEFGVDGMMARLEQAVAASQQRIKQSEKIVSYSRSVIRLCREQGALAPRLKISKEQAR